jgi:hypothetical protein
MAAAVAASGAVFVGSGGADPLLAAAAEQVAARTGGAPAEAAGAASPERSARVSFSWNLGSPRWDATLPQPRRLTAARSIDPANPAKPAQPAQPRPPDGTPPDDGRPPIWYGIAASNPKVELEPMRSCPQFRGPSARIWMTVTPRKGGVTLSWWDIDDPETLRYEIGAFRRAGLGSGSSPGAMTWTRVPLPAARGCRTMTATITGLASGVGYDFWLEAVNRDPLDKSRTYRMSRGRTEVLDIP